MKTLAIVALVIAIAVVFAVTASGANNKWSLYGSVRMATFWTSQDYGDLYKSNANISGDDVFGRSGVRNLQWNLQSNSRIGATVKDDKLEARFEFGVISDGSGGNVSSRRLYNVWYFSEN